MYIYKHTFVKEEPCNENIIIYSMLSLHFLVLCLTVSLFEFETLMNEEMPGHYSVTLIPQQMHVAYCPLSLRGIYNRGFPR